DRGVPELERLLRDPSPEIAAAAADALRMLAPVIRQNPAEATQVSNDLMQVLRQRTGPPGQPDPQPGADTLRQSLVGALAPLAGANDPGQMLNLFSDLLNQAESRAVRESALGGLAALKEKGADIIAHELDPAAEPDPRVRAAAAGALKD